MTVTEQDPRFAGLTTEQRVKLAELLEVRAAATAWRCNLPDCDGSAHEGRDYVHARAKQRPPWGQFFDDGEPVRRWYFRGGRGAGKTWAGARALAELVLRYGGTTDGGVFRTWGVVGPTHVYTKQTLIEGDSGLLRALGGENGPHVQQYNRTTGTITMTSGAVIYSGGADNHGGSIEGKNLSGVWCDEVGLWAHARWEYTHDVAIDIATRIDPALYIYTGTPKQGHPLVRRLIEDPHVYKVVSGTLENSQLPDHVKDRLLKRLDGTRLGRQELYGELLLDTPGALWSNTQLDQDRLGVPGKPVPAPDDMVQIVVGWDPAVTSGEDSDEHGLIVAARLAGDPAHYVILEDASGVFTPLGAARVAADLFEKWDANHIVVEKNQGGDTWLDLMRTVAPTLPVKTVTATRGKRLRAEPIAALSEQGRLHMVGTFPKLEDQMTTWSPASPGSPDRLDAMVWAVTALNDQANGTPFFSAGSSRKPGGK